MTDILDCCLVIYVIYVFKQNVHLKKINNKLKKIKTPCNQPPSEAHLKVYFILLLFFRNHTCICIDKKVSVLKKLNNLGIFSYKRKVVALRVTKYP